MGRAGVRLHIPRGYWHRAGRAGEGAGYSLHATFGIQQRTGVDLLTWLADQCAREHELFRRDLPHAGAADQNARTRELAEAATELLCSVDFDQYRRWRQQHQPSARHVATHGRSARSRRSWPSRSSRR
ncbi:MAG: hypothetical protein JO272_06095 [Pseudonocardiales bacterium]|nr:hypothetical protein [Pseudonocardiales bacterium]